MCIDLFEETLICLEVASPSMETKDAHEHILVVGKVRHRLDILDMGVLKKQVHHENKRVRTGMYLVCTSTYQS